MISCWAMKDKHDPADYPVFCVVSDSRCVRALLFIVSVCFRHPGGEAEADPDDIA